MAVPKTDLLLVKSGPVQNGGNASERAFKKRKKKSLNPYPNCGQRRARWECMRGSNVPTPRSVQNKGQEELQAPELTFLCSP